MGFSNSTLTKRSLSTLLPKDKDENSGVSLALYTLNAIFYLRESIAIYRQTRQLQGDLQGIYRVDLKYLSLLLIVLLYILSTYKKCSKI